MTNIPGRCDDNPVRSIVSLQVIEYRFPVYGGNRLAGTQDGHAQGMLLPKQVVKEIMDMLLRRIFHHIYLLENGEIVAQGNHEELLQSSPLYQEIYDSQLGGGVTAGLELEEVIP